MTIQDIEKFLLKKADSNFEYVKISFKKRKEIYGLFVRDGDYDYLKAKNFWRIVTRVNFDEFNSTGNLALARIFHGSEFSRISSYEESF
jgi:hypothetical protein